MDKFVYVTSLSTDSYLLGVLGLNDSLIRVKSQYPLYVVCSDRVSSKCLKILSYFHIQYMVLDEHFPIANVSQTRDREAWTYTFDKLYIWKLKQFSKIVFLDADTQVVANIDHLFKAPHLAAVIADKFDEPDLMLPNSGVMVIEPNQEDFDGMLNLWESGKLRRYDNGDQDIIRAYFQPIWGGEQILPYGYNVLYNLCYSWANKTKKSDVDPIFVIHYVGKKKPWMMSIKAVYRRSKHNFLGEYLMKYGKRLFWLKLNVFIVRIFI